MKGWETLTIRVTNWGGMQLVFTDIKVNATKLHCGPTRIRLAYLNSWPNGYTMQAERLPGELTHFCSDNNITSCDIQPGVRDTPWPCIVS